MIDLPISDLLQLILVATFAGLLDTIVGFGGGLLLLPVLMLIFGGTDAIVLSALIPIGWNAVRMRPLREFFDVDAFRLFLFGVVPGVLLGALILPTVDEASLRVAVGAVLILLGAYHVLRLYVDIPMAKVTGRILFPTTGFVGGALAAIIGAGNGPTQSWSMAAAGLTPRTIVAVNGGIGLVMSLTRLGGYGIGGLLEGVPWVVGAVGLAAAVLGGYLGVRLARRAPDSLIRLLIGLVIIVAGVRLVI